MEGFLEKTIELIRRNRISTTEVADALGKTGLLDPRIVPINARKFAVGKVRYIAAFNGSNWHAHRLIQDVMPDEMVLVEGVNCEGRAIFGELVSKFVLLYRQAAGIVVKGSVRDVSNLIKEGYSIWACGKTPIGCVNADCGFDDSYFTAQRQKYDGGLMVADDSGVIFVSRNEINADFYDKLIAIEEQEDRWFDAIDRLKLTTFETVCLRKYEDGVHE